MNSTVKIEALFVKIGVSIWSQEQFLQNPPKMGEI